MSIIEGVTQRGAGIQRGPGAEFFVDAENGSDTYDGLAWGRAKATIQAAITLCTTGKGDIIWIAPGTYEEELTLTKDYVRLEGAMDNGYARPDIAPTTGKALYASTAQGVTLRHLRFVSVDDDVVHLEGNGSLIEDCVFDGEGIGATKALLRLQGRTDDDSYTGSEGIVRDCLFRLSGGYGLAFDTGSGSGNGVGVTHALIERCRFLDNTGVDVVALKTGVGGVYSVQDVLLSRCHFMEPKNKATWIDITTNADGAAANQTGMLEDCYFNDDTVDATAIKISGTGFGVVGCHSMDGEFDGSGLDD